GNSPDIGSSSKVSGAYQDGAREFVGKRPRLAGRFSGEAEKLVGTVRLEFAEGIRKLTKNTRGHRRRKTVKLAKRMPEVAGLPRVRSIVILDDRVWL
ncbi:hypothetical protein BHE74_00028629, partial [Ensete ventricosum]